MKKFPNKMIREAYESAKGKVFTRNSGDLSFTDEDGCNDYNHHALGWLYDQGVMQRTIDIYKGPMVYKYRIVK